MSFRGLTPVRVGGLESKSLPLLQRDAEACRIGGKIFRLGQHFFRSLDTSLPSFTPCLL